MASTETKLYPLTDDNMNAILDHVWDMVWDKNPDAKQEEVERFDDSVYSVLTPHITKDGSNTISDNDLRAIADGFRIFKSDASDMQRAYLETLLPASLHRAYFETLLSGNRQSTAPAGSTAPQQLDIGPNPTDSEPTAPKAYPLNKANIGPMLDAVGKHVATLYPEAKPNQVLAFQEIAGIALDKATEAKDAKNGFTLSDDALKAVAAGFAHKDPAKGPVQSLYETVMTNRTRAPAHGQGQPVFGIPKQTVFSTRPVQPSRKPAAQAPASQPPAPPAAPPATQPELPEDILTVAPGGEQRTSSTPRPPAAKRPSGRLRKAALWGLGLAAAGAAAIVFGPAIVAAAATYTATGAAVVGAGALGYAGKKLWWDPRKDERAEKKELAKNVRAQKRQIDANAAIAKHERAKMPATTPRSNSRLLGFVAGAIAVQAVVGLVVLANIGSEAKKKPETAQKLANDKSLSGKAVRGSDTFVSTVTDAPKRFTQWIKEATLGEDKAPSAVASASAPTTQQKDKPVTKASTAKAPAAAATSASGAQGKKSTGRHGVLTGMVQSHGCIYIPGTGVTERAAPDTNGMLNLHVDIASDVPACRGNQNIKANPKDVQFDKTAKPTPVAGSGAQASAEPQRPNKVAFRSFGMGPNT